MKRVTLELGGKRIDRDGYFVEPTLLIRASAEMSLMRDEVFGPVLGATAFADASDLDHIASLANDTQYGLAAKIWTRDLRSAHQLARKLQAGWITINGGREGALSFTEIKSCAAPISSLDKLNGFILNSHTNGEYLDDPKYWPALEAAEALDACIYIHPRAASDTLKGPLQDYGMDSAMWGYGVEVGTHVVRMMAAGCEFDARHSFQITWVNPIPMLASAQMATHGARSMREGLDFPYYCHPWQTLRVRHRLHEQERDQETSIGRRRP